MVRAKEKFGQVLKAAAKFGQAKVTATACPLHIQTLPRIL
jgi:hypothetical protein